MTQLRPSDLPDFSNPPVVETVLSVQFDRLALMRTAHFGMYWRGIYDRFPKTEERVELPRIVEPPPQQLPSGVGIQFEALEAPPAPRFWFANEKGTELIQVQKDRFIKNWRKTGDGDEYPRYESVRDGFDRDFSGFREFVSKRQLGEVRVNQCEVTYINHIFAGKGWETHADIDKVFTLWQQPSAAFPGRAQDTAFHSRFQIADSRGNFVGRLHVKVSPVIRPPDGCPMFLLELTARGQIDESMSFFDLGREWIVRSFKSITTPMMHEIWGIRS